MSESSQFTVEPNNTWGRAVRQILALVILSAVAAVAVNALRPDRLPLVGDWSVAARITSSTGERMDISMDQAEKLFFTDAAVFIDARSEEDYARGHIQNARCLPWQEVDLRFMSVTEALDLEMPIITYCDGEVRVEPQSRSVSARCRVSEHAGAGQRLDALAAGGPAHGIRRAPGWPVIRLSRMNRS